MVIKWWNDDGAWGAGDWVAMSLTMVVFWGLVAVVVVWIVRRTRNGQASTPGQETSPVDTRADEVLADRFARGEIDADEYGQRRALLHCSTSRS